MAIPKYDEPFNPFLQALHDLGGSATNQEFEDKVIELLPLPEEEAYERREGKLTTLLARKAPLRVVSRRKHGTFNRRNL